VEDIYERQSHAELIVEKERQRLVDQMERHEQRVMSPLLPRIVFHAYAFTRYEAHHGMITRKYTNERTVRLVLWNARQNATGTPRTSRPGP